MAVKTRRIGLSLGADICWPGCYEEIIRRLDLAIPDGPDEVRIEVERISVEPFNMRQPCKYDVVLDRLTHWFDTSREWIKKAVILDDLYVLNNPWAIQSMEKHTTYGAMMRLGLPVPETWLVPPKEHRPHPDVQSTLNHYARYFDIGEIGRKLGFPLYVKPYDGGAWVGVSRADNETQLRDAYEKSGTRVLHLQKAIEPFDLFVRGIGIGPHVEIVRYDPTAPLHRRYMVDFNFLDAEEWSLMTDMTLTINSFFGWEFNSCEALRKDGVFSPIDFANACPDFQVTSLHYHFPNMVKAMIRWSIFCAVTDRPMRKNLDWAPYFAIAEQDLPYRERLRAYADIARERFEAVHFADFCEEHLANLDEVVLDFFSTERARELVREKVAALFPSHEVERFAAHFWGLLAFWRKTEVDRMAMQGEKP